MKKIKTLILPALAATFLVGCGSPSGTDFINGDTAKESIYAFEAVTSIGLLSEAKASMNPQGLRKAISLDQAFIDSLNTYLPTIESALKGESLLTNTEVMASDDPNYQVKQVISYTDINMQTSTITMYYNETIIEDNDWDDDDDDWDDEQEQESRIEGVVLVDGVSYRMRGEKELEGDEYEVNFRYILDETSYILVEQEIERGETEFAYSLVQNGREVYEYSLEIEGNEVSLEMESGRSEYEMNFFLTKLDGKNLIGCRLENDHEKETIFFEKIVSPEGQVTYQQYLPTNI